MLKFEFITKGNIVYNDIVLLISESNETPRAFLEIIYEFYNFVKYNSVINADFVLENKALEINSTKNPTNLFELLDIHLHMYQTILNKEFNEYIKNKFNFKLKVTFCKKCLQKQVYNCDFNEISIYLCLNMVQDIIKKIMSDRTVVIIPRSGIANMIFTHVKQIDKSFETSKNIIIKLNEYHQSILDILEGYITNSASNGDVILIEKLESELHPKYQQALVRIIARLANSGVTVIMGTDSITVINELNNLLLMPRPVILENGYDYYELLQVEDISVYEISETIEKKLLDNDKGIVDTSIQNVSNRQNKISTAIKEML